VIGEIESELKELDPLSDLPFIMADFHCPVKTRLVLGYLPRKNLTLLSDSAEPWNRAAWEEFKSGVGPETMAVPSEGETPASKGGGDRVRIVIAFLAEDSSDVRKGLGSIEFDEIQLPKLSMRIIERADELQSDLAEYKQK
jgi:hypothetical protein